MGTPSATRRVLVWLPCIVLLSSLLGCFEPPVRENMEIVFHPNGAMQVEVTTRLLVSTDSSPATTARLDEIREAISRREDTWSRSLMSLAPAVRRETYEYDHEVLSVASRAILAEEPEAIRDLFSWTQVGTSLSRKEDVMTLELLPGPGGGATLRQQRMVRESLDMVSASVSSYLAATADLYTALEDSPEAARPCFEEILKGLIDDNQRGGELTDVQAELAKRVKDLMSDVWQVLVVPEGEAYTLDELSHMVYDPFPAPLQIEVAGTVEEVEGFERLSERRVAVPGLGLWDALESLQGRWIDPDPLLIYVEESRREGGPQLDLDEISARPRQARWPPDQAEVKKAIEGRLRAAALYRLRWRLPPEGEGAGSPEDARQARPPEQGR